MIRPLPVRRLIDAVNAGDAGALLDAFDDGGAVDDRGRIHRGRSAIAAWSSSVLIRAGVRLSVLSVEGDDTFTMVVAEDQRGGTGLRTFTFALDGESIRLMTVL